MTRYIQPQAGPFLVDSGNPLNRGILSVFHGPSPATNIATGAPFSGAGTGTSTALTKKGVGVALTGSGTGRFYGPIAEGTQMTVILLAAMTRSVQNSRPFSTFTGTGVGKFDFFFNTGSAPIFQAFRGTTNGQFNPSSAAWYDGNLHVFAITYDESSNSNVPSFYVDGVLDTSATTLAAPSGSVVSASNVLSWGGRADVTNRQIAGTIVEGFFFNHVLSQSEIAQATANLWQLFLDDDTSFFVAGTGGGNVTVTLASQVITSSAGTIGITNNIPLSTQLSSTSYGSVSFEFSTTLSSQFAAVSQGIISPSVVYTLTGQQVTSGIGTITYSSGTNISVTLNSQTMLSSQGSLGFTNSISLSGIDTTTSYGTIVPNVSFTFASQLSGTSQGSLDYSVGAFLTGQQAHTTAGTIASTTTIGLLGKQMGVVAGTMTFSSGSGGAVYPLPSQVAYGVVYGPTGTEYVGTFIGNMTVEITTGALVKPLTPKLSILL